MTAAARRLDLADPSAAPSSSEYVDLAFVAVLGLLGIVGFRTVYGGWSWLTTGGAGLAAGMALGLVGRRRRLDPLLLAVAAAALYFVLSGIAISQEALGAVVPTPGTLQGAAVGAVRSWAELLTAVPPVGHLGNLGVVPLICGLVGGLLSTSAALRSRGIVGPLAPLVAVVVVSILFGTDRPASLVLQGAAFAAVAVGWLAYRRRGTRVSASSTVGPGRLVGGVLMLVLAGIVATVGGDQLPGLAQTRFILRDYLDPPFDPRQHPSPLASFARYKSDRRELGDLRDRTLFSVAGMPDRVPIRLAVLDTYDGVVWKVAGGSTSNSGVFERVGDVVPPDRTAQLPRPTDTARVSFTVENYNDIWLPDFGSVTGIQFGGPRARALADALRFNRVTNVGAVPLRFEKGDRIVVDAGWSPPIPQGQPGHPYAGKAAAAIPVGDAERIADGLAELTDRILSSGPQAVAVTPAEPAGPAPAEGAEAPAAIAPGFDSVLRVAQEFVINSSYGYSDGQARTNATASGGARSLSGHSFKRMSSFASDSLEAGATYGNGEQYASALALIARNLKVPSRVVMGFCLQTCADGKVTGADVSAWVEIAVEGVGWVPLDPTPSPDKQVQDRVKPKPKPKPKNASQPPPPPVTVPPPEEVVADNVSPKKKDRDSDSLLGDLPWGTIAAIGLPLIVVGGFVGGVLTAKRRRRRRRCDDGTPMQRVVGGWEELEDRSYDLGRPLPGRATRREIATFLGSDAAQHSARLADSTIFGPSVPSDAEIDDYWTSIDETYEELVAEMGPLRRLRADLNPASLVRRARDDLSQRRPWRRGRGGGNDGGPDDTAGPEVVDLRETVDA